MFFWRRSALAFCLMIAVPTHGVSAAAMTTSQSTAIDAAAMRALNFFHLPGLSVAVERDGEVAYAKGYGYREVATKTPVDPATYFEIGSVTKQFTSTAIAMLVADGKLRFDDTIATYLPDAPHAREITIQELLNQTSGLPDYLVIRRFIRSCSRRPRRLPTSTAS